MRDRKRRKSERLLTKCLDPLIQNSRRAEVLEFSIFLYVNFLKNDLIFCVFCNPFFRRKGEKKKSITRKKIDLKISHLYILRQKSKMAKTVYEINKKATQKWREANQEHYNEYHRDYASNYYEKNKVKIRQKLRRDKIREINRIFNEQCKILRNIDIF